MTTMPIRDANLFVEVLGAGPPLLLMHGGPGLDHISLTPFRELADEHTTVFYDHRCNGRSAGPAVETMTWENLTADADALREALGFGQWAVLGHSFGGHVALEYALRYPERVSRLILLDTAAEAVWSQEHAPKGPRRARLRLEDRQHRPPLLQRRGRAEGLHPGCDPAPADLRQSVQPRASRTRDG